MKAINEPENISRNPAAFIIPFYGDQERSLQYLNETIESLFSQTDFNWRAIIVDDATPGKEAKNYLQNIEQRFPLKIKVLWQKTNQGQGVGRNIAIQWAFEQGYPFVLFNDADDISHPDRVKVVREIFLEYPTVDLVYSTFKVINEDGHLVPRDQILPDIADIIKANESDPVEGYNAWIKIGTDTGFACLPSSTAVRTSIAYTCPSPSQVTSEDAHLWMHIAARGNEFKYTPLIPTLYRIPTGVDGSTHRSRLGKKNFYEGKVKIDTGGFLNAIRISLEKGTISPDQVGDLKTKFFRRLAETLIKVDEPELAEKLLQEHGDQNKM